MHSFWTFRPSWAKTIYYAVRVLNVIPKQVSRSKDTAQMEFWTTMHTAFKKLSSKKNIRCNWFKFVIRGGVAASGLAPLAMNQKYGKNTPASRSNWSCKRPRMASGGWHSKTGDSSTTKSMCVDYSRNQNGAHMVLKVSGNRVSIQVTQTLNHHRKRLNKALILNGI